ncbi:retrotransposon protein, putative, ty1-copia subclass [Tanacetum coccineum]
MLKGRVKGKARERIKVISLSLKTLNLLLKEHLANGDTCHHYKEVGHYKRNCPAYLAKLIKKKKQVGTASSSNIFLTPPYTLQHNGISKRRNTTLLDMVRSMMNLTTLPLSFSDYALETATCILNMVPTKKVNKTPYELWYGKVPNLSYLKETMGYYFYFPPKNKIVVARYAEFLEKNLLSQEVSGRAVELEEIQDEDTSPSKNTCEIPMEVEGFEPPQEKVVFVRRPARTHQAHEHLCLNVVVEEHSLGDLNEPTNYKAALLDQESDKLLGVSGFSRKKTDMDGNVHTYKAHLVAKDYTQTYGVVYEETFSPIADIRAIRILIGIEAFYDYEIWKMDVKTAFLNGYLDENIYMVSKHLIRLSQSAYMDKILKRYRMDNSKRGNISMQERLDLNKTQDASTPGEVKHMQNVPYASAVVDWKSSKQSTTAMSATEAEYIAALEALMEVVWIRKFISGLGIVLIINEPIRMFCDNSTALHFANEPGAQKGTRHYHRRYHYVRECIALGEIRFLKVHTDDNLADPFTKALPKGKLTQHARSMGLRLASSVHVAPSSRQNVPFAALPSVSMTTVVEMAQPVQNINHSAFRSMFEREKLSGNNFNDWFRQLKLVLRVEKKMFVIEQPLPAAPAADSAANVLVEWNAIYDAYNEVACLILGSMTPELHRQFENSSPYDMIKELKSMFEKQAGVERFVLIQTFHACKQEEGKPVAAYVLQMKGYVDQLERLGYVLPQDLTVGLILNGLTKDFAGFVKNYNMHNMGKTIDELHAMLIEYEKGLPKKVETPQVMMIKSGKTHKANKKSLKAKGKGKANANGKDKQVYISKPKNPKPTAKEHPTKDDTYHHCKEVGHWKRNCHVYLAELLNKKK